MEDTTDHNASSGSIISPHWPRGGPEDLHIGTSRVDEAQLSVPFGGKGVNDALALPGILANCSSNATIVFSDQTTYNIS